MLKEKLSQKIKVKKTGDHWCTPFELYSEICEKYNGGSKFGFDPCANEWSSLGILNAISPTAPYGKALGQPFFNGLETDWSQFRTVFMNPPYSQWQTWIKKAYEASQEGCTVLSLLMNASAEPAFHSHVMRGEIVEIRGRVQYVDPINNSKGSPTFGSILSIFRPYADYNGRPPVSSWWPDLHQNRGQSRRKIAAKP